MRLTLRAEDGALDLAFADRGEAERFFENAEREQGFFLHLEHKLKQFQRLELKATAPDFRFVCQAEVIQLFPGPSGHGTAMRLCDWDEGRRAALDDALNPADGDDAGGDGRERPGEGGQSPIFRIKKMNPSERFRLAMKASRVERQILLRDSSPQVLLGLLAHPRIEDREVIEILKSNYASAGLMQRVADNKKWMSNADIRLLVVRSPKTPAPIAIKHLPTLRTGELRMMAKGAGARETLRRAALKEYLKRTGRR